jgi:polar amino acid transport system substrate-binding protein
MACRHLIAADLLEPGVLQNASILKVGAALPDPPFEFMTESGPAGFDITLMKRVAEILDQEWQLVTYDGADFNSIFAGLDDGSYDCIASGTTVTPARRKIADFCQPYAVSGQSLVVDVRRCPNVRGVADLKGKVIGVQQGNTSPANSRKTGRRAPRRTRTGLCL